MYLYQIREQGNFFEPKNLFTSNKELTHKEVIDGINKLFDVKFKDLGEFRIAIGERIHTIFSEKVRDPMQLIRVTHLN